MKLITEKNYTTQMEAILPALASICTPGTFARIPGEDIYYELYSAEESKGWIVISHGFTESAAKYAEVIWYLTQAGYSVAILEHRGHGRSYRNVEETWVTNVDNFDDYRDDLIFFIQEVVIPKLADLPLFVLGHSMGGAIVAHVAMYAPELPVEKYILSSPMVAAVTGGMPTAVTKIIDELSIHRGKGHEPVFVQGPFDPKGDFEEDWCCATSEARYYWYLDIQKEHPEFQNSAATYNWLREAMRQSSYLLNPENALRVEVPVLLIQAAKDTMVKNDAQDKLVELLPNARKVTFPAAKHEIFRCTDMEVKEYINLILNFLQK